MPETILRRDPATRDVAHDVRSVCLLMPPQWELDGFVAVNPFVGFGSMPFEDAARAIADVREATVLPGSRWFRSSARDADTIHRAASSLGCSVSHLNAMLDGQASKPVRQREVPYTLAEGLDRRLGTRWEERARIHAASACAEHVAPAAGVVAPADGLYVRWLADAKLDHGLEWAGLAGFRRWLTCLPASPDQAIAAMLERLELPVWERHGYLYRLLHGVAGWASYLRRWAWQRDREDPGLVLDLLAIRICLDTAIAELAPRASLGTTAAAAADPVEDERFSMALQDAMEDEIASGIAGRFVAPPPVEPVGRPSSQCVFCIDVRSERLRRHLEAADPAIETIGFAGFFGVAVEWSSHGVSSRRCPVLLNPGFRTGPEVQGAADTDHSLLQALLRAPSAAFVGVETLGLGALAKLVRAGLGRIARPRRDADETIAFERSIRHDLPLDVRVDLAERLLLGLGMTDRFARLVLLCGHQGCSANNPHAASLHCGACGGRGGALNARIAASILNDGQVRAILAGIGRQIPEDTWFVAGLHDTSTDQVRLLDSERAPASHHGDVAHLQKALQVAGAMTRRERAWQLGLSGSDQALDAALGRRAADWSETRPEWGLAGNQAFVVARRARTRGVDLAGRAFLHEYDAGQDPSGAVLELILSAPMVVASWINLQYLASTVDPGTFGAGDKNLLNRSGDVGVVLGDGRDLRPGLPLQSVKGTDGGFLHEPVRLQVFVEASRARISEVLERQPAVRELVENGWVRLFSLSPHGAAVARWKPGLGWEPFRGEEDQESGGKEREAGRRPLDLPQQSRPRSPSAGQGSGTSAS